MCTKRLFNLSADATISFLNARSLVSCAIFPLKNKQNRLNWSLVIRFIFSQRGKNHFKMLLEMCIVQHAQTKSVFKPSTNKTYAFFDCTMCKACSHVLIIPFKDQKLANSLFGGYGTHCFAKKTNLDYEKQNPLPFSKKLIRQSQPSTPQVVSKNGKKSFQFWQNRVDIQIVQTANLNFNSNLSLGTRCLQ